MNGKGYSPAEISGALYQLRRAADVSQGGLYEANKRVYSLLRWQDELKEKFELNFELLSRDLINATGLGNP